MGVQCGAYVTRRPTGTLSDPRDWFLRLKILIAGDFAADSRQLSEMSQAEPSLAFPSTGNRPAVRAFVGQDEVISSGVLILTSDSVATLRVSSLTFKFRFEGNEGENSAIEVEDVSDTGYTIVLKNFANPLGTTLNRTEVGTVDGRKIWLSIFVEAVGEAKKIRVMHFSVLWENPDG